MIKILSVVGARPQFVKASVLRKLFTESNDFEEILIHTGQHYDVNMSDIFFEDLSIPAPNIKLGINGGGQGATTGLMLQGIEGALLQHKPDACLVYGDTNSTLAGALAAAKLHIPIIHIEAGLRSFNKAMPEEINRILTDHVSELLFCPTTTGVNNLTNEGITKNVYHVGDIMFDAVTMVSQQSAKIKHIQSIDLSDNNLAACSLHRAENTDDAKKLQSLIDYLNTQCDKYNIVLPLHPRTKKALSQFNIKTGKITLINPIGYIEMQALLAASQMVFTDSGGLQKEAYFNQTPCVTLRGETEWVELIDAGWNKLWTDNNFKPRKDIIEYGKGQSGALILDKIKSYFLSKA